MNYDILDNICNTNDKLTMEYDSPFNRGSYMALLVCTA